MAELSSTQKEILEFICARHARTGVYPSVREIGEHMGFKSTNTVDYHLRRLEAAGAIERSRAARTYVIRQSGRRRNARIAHGDPAGIPILGRVAAGEPILAEQNVDGMVNFRSYFHCDERTFALRVKGDSMIEAGIVDGDLVIVRQQLSVENGEIGVAIVGDEATVKRVYDEGAVWRLEPENRAMQAIVVRKSENQFRVAGKVIGVIRRI